MSKIIKSEITDEELFAELIEEGSNTQPEAETSDEDVLAEPEAAGEVLETEDEDEFEEDEAEAEEETPETADEDILELRDLLHSENPDEEEIAVSNLDDIVAEFSAEASPESSEERKAALPRRRSGFKFVLACFLAFAVLVAATVGVFYLRWYETYQSSLPEQKSVSVFSLLFQDPDWALLYTMSGTPDGAFENRDIFVQYMNITVGDKPLSYMEIPQDDPLLRAYTVFHGSTPIGEFTMRGIDNDIPEWNLDSVKLYTEREQSVTILKAPDATAYVNGVAVDSTYMIRSTSTLAENFLPDDVHGYRMEELYVPGLMLPPKVVVLDTYGREVELDYDSETCTYSPKVSDDLQIGDDHINFALEAAKASAAFAVRATSFTELRQYFDPNSAAYEQICNTAPLLEGCASYTFDPSATKVDNYRSYGNDMFSATVTLKLDVVMANGDAHSYDMTYNYLYEQSYSGTFMIIQISDQSFHIPHEQVRLTFISGTEELDSMMVNAKETLLHLPDVTAPAGTTFAGWAKEITDEDGNTSLGIVFTPDENNAVTLDPETPLEPSLLFAVFEELE